MRTKRLAESSTPTQTMLIPKAPALTGSTT